jgi:hypothetical protein
VKAVPRSLNAGFGWLGAPDGGSLGSAGFIRFLSRNSPSRSSFERFCRRDWMVMLINPALLGLLFDRPECAVASDDDRTSELPRCNSRPIEKSRPIDALVRLSLPTERLAESSLTTDMSGLLRGKSAGGMDIEGDTDARGRGSGGTLPSLDSEASRTGGSEWDTEEGARCSDTARRCSWVS